MSDRRMLLVHAHPDDEVVGTGATIARYRDAGAAVTLVTCTSGEEGEVLVPDLEHLAAAHEDRLGAHRREEIVGALAALGIDDHHWLGGPGRYRDSGMMGTDANEHAESFWRADLLQAATDLVAVIRDRRPQVLITYDENGQYGHPDHIQAHRVAMYGAALAAAEAFRPDLGAAWDIPKIYWTALPHSYVAEGIRVLAESGSSGFFGATEPGELPGVVADELVSAVIDGTDYAEQKVAALRAHATQVAADGPFFAIAEAVGPAAFGREHFRLAKGRAAEPFGSDGRELDLFAGV